MINRPMLAAALLVLAASCTSTKKSTTDDYSVNVDLDTIEITASRENPYRSSATKDFDLIHTKLEVGFDYAHQYLNGKATITLKPHFYPQYALTLDAKQFDIKEISLLQKDNTHKKLEYSYDSLQLNIQLDKKYEAGEQLKIYIDYTAKPEERQSGGSAAISEDKGLYFINPLGSDTNKPVQIWTQGETESNSCWFPTIDKPNQKFTNEIYITHLKKYSSLSNGTLISTTAVNDSLVTDYWKMDLPHAPYLVMMAIGDFAVIKDRWRDITVDYWVEKSYAPYARQIFGNTPEMIEFFSQKLGFDYPWQKYSQVVVRDYVSGAMENTSATLHGEFVQRNSRELLDETNEDIISHELFHQWFGDLVTCESWSNIPLNESFATYGEYLWNEYKYGRQEADYKQHQNYMKYLEEAKEKNVDLIRFYYEDREDMFDRHSYEKGGLILHYLRKTLGDEAFFKSLELYLKNNQFKPVEIHQLRLAFEETTGQDLNWFFNQWFLNEGHPVLDIKYSYTADSAYITIDQKQNVDKGLTYKLPAKVSIQYGTTAETHSIVLNKKSQVFGFKITQEPTLVDFDAERSVLCEKTENKTIDNYIIQYKTGQLFEQRLEALKHLKDEQKDNLPSRNVMLLALYDNHYALRKYAIEQLLLPKENKDSLLTIITEIAQKDKVAEVRKAAITKLGNEKKPDYAALFEKACGDSSYEVTAAALKALNEVDSKKALALAKLFENDKNINLINAVADVYSKEGDADYGAYFDNKLRTAQPYSKYSLFYYYANFLTRMDKDIVLKGIKTIEELGAQAEGHFLSGAAKGSLKRIVKSFEDKKKKAQSDIAAEQGQTAKLELQENVTSYDLIISEANDAINRLGKKKQN